jgi:HAAS domain-containing protein
MKSTADKLVDEYLDRLNRELAGFPRARRRELVDEISGHIAEARADLETENEAAMRTLLDRLGDPADIAAEARERPAAPRAKASGWDVVALILLLIGGVIFPREADRDADRPVRPCSADLPANDRDIGRILFRRRGHRDHLHRQRAPW